MTSAPAIDGDLSDEVWKAIPEMSGFWDRANNVLVDEQTFVRIGYDRQNIYVAWDCRDTKPEAVFGQDTREDAHYENQNGLDGVEDGVELRLDPYLSHDNRSQIWFYVNPLGTRSAYFGGGRANKTEWKGEWKAAAKKTATGWSVEMQIPWKMLNYPAGKRTMGVNFVRVQSRTKMRSFWSNIGPTYRHEDQGRWLGVEGPTPDRPKIEVLPYVLAGADEDRGIFRSGVDLRYPITPDLTAVSTINPDFGTVEGAVESISFSRSERFVPDRRPFFLEGAQYFNAGDSFDIGRHFYARRIDRFDLGTKLYGKVTPKDTLGFLHTIHFGERSDIVAKWDHKVRERESYNVFVNHKNSRTDEGTLVSGNYFKQWGKLFFDPRVAISGDNGRHGNAVNLGFGYEDTNNFGYLALQDTSKDFRMPDGLLGFTDFKGVLLYDEWSTEWKKGTWRFMQVQNGATMNWKHDGSPFQRDFNTNIVFITRKDAAIQFGAQKSYFGNQEDLTYNIGAGTDISNRYKKIGLAYTFGTIAGEKYGQLGFEISRQLLPGFVVSANGSLVNFQGHERQSIVTATYELSPTRSFGGRMVERNGDVNWYLSFRESAKRGNEFYVILGDPNAQKFRRSLQVKLLLPLSITT